MDIARERGGNETLSFLCTFDIMHAQIPSLMMELGSSYALVAELASPSTNLSSRLTVPCL